MGTIVVLAVGLVATCIVGIASCFAVVFAMMLVSAVAHGFVACVLAFAELVNWLATLVWRLVSYPFRALYRFVARKVTHRAR